MTKADSRPRPPKQWAFAREPSGVAGGDGVIGHDMADGGVDAAKLEPPVQMSSASKARTPQSTSVVSEGTAESQNADLRQNFCASS